MRLAWTLELEIFHVHKEQEAARPAGDTDGTLDMGVSCLDDAARNLE